MSTDNRSALGLERHRVPRMLCCGVQDYNVLRMFKVALAAVYGGIDFVSLHTTDPEVVEDYRRRFSPDFVVLANGMPPDPTATVRPTPTGNCTTSTQHESKGLVVDRFIPERPLTERQITVLQYLRNGCTNKKIAEYMGVHPRTVKEWLKYLYLFFGVSNRTQLVATVMDSGEASGPLFGPKSPGFFHRRTTASS